MGTSFVLSPVDTREDDTVTMLSVEGRTAPSQLHPPAGHDTGGHDLPFVRVRHMAGIHEHMCTVDRL